TPTHAIYTLSLHDALPIFDGRDTGQLEMPTQHTDDGVVLAGQSVSGCGQRFGGRPELVTSVNQDLTAPTVDQLQPKGRPVSARRSEEHTSELQSRGHLVCR